MSKNNFLKFIKRQFSSITIEPVIFLSAISKTIISGSEVNTNFLISKICRIELNYSQEVCDSLSNYTEAKEDVQEYVNNFQMNSQWISSVPIVLFSIIAGALSDVFGRKPLILWPLIGNLLAIVCGIINYTFQDELPLEFFYLDNISAFFGGYAVYYLGMYSYGTNVSKPKERAYRLARLDGAETIAVVAGTLISPRLFDWLGFYGNFGISGGVMIFAILYHFFIVGEPLKNEETEKNSNEKNRKEKSRNALKFLTKAFVTPILGMRDLLTKKRKPILMFLIFLQFVWFCFYWLIIEVKIMLYLYMLLVFNISASDFATFNVVINICHAVCLMIVVPILSQKLKIHDAMLIVIILATEVISFAISPFVDSLWQFYLAQAFGAMGYCKYSIVRSLISKCIESDEIGKVFSLLAVVAALTPVAGNPMFRRLYDATLKNFPGSIFILAGSFCFVAAIGNLFLFFKRNEMKNAESRQQADEKNEEHLEISRF